MNNKLHEYLLIADDICSLAKEISDQYNDIVNQGDITLPYQRHVVLSLYRKMYCSFVSLCDDAHKGRPESMHHLKTMAECYIYFIWMMAGDSEKRAKLIEAKICEEKVNYFSLNRDFYPDSDRYIKNELDIKAGLIKEIEDDYKKFRNKKIGPLAKECNLEPAYNAIYKLACQPAHIADLYDYTHEDGQFSLDRSPEGALLSCISAVHYSIFIAIALCEYAVRDKVFEQSPIQNAAGEKIASLRIKYEMVRK